MLPLLIFVWSGGVYFYIILSLIFMGMIFEFSSLSHNKENKNFNVFIKFLIVFFALLPFVFLILFPNLIITFFICSLIPILFYYIIFSHNLIAFLFIFLILISGISAILISRINSHLLFFLLIIIFSSDICAYFSGKFLGGPKLWPSISPNKTWSGSIGGILGSILASLIISIGGSVFENIIIGVLLSFSSQLGDLLESSFKRREGVKDSGFIIPGHGGVLDRMDSFVISLPFIYLILKLNFFSII